MQLDRKIRFRVEPKTALAIKRLREQFHTAMGSRMRGKPLTSKQQEWFDLGLRYLATGQWDEEQSIVVN